MSPAEDRALAWLNRDALLHTDMTEALRLLKLVRNVLLHCLQIELFLIDKINISTTSLLHFQLLFKKW